MDSNSRIDHADEDNLKASITLQTKSSETNQTEIVYNCAFHGTCSSIEDIVSPYYPYGEAIADMRTRMVGYINGLDGVGSGAKPLAKYYSTTTQILFGWGTEINLKTAMDDIRRHYRYAKEHNIPFKVNLSGWSRGAAAAISLASLMYNDPELIDIPVNLFAIDPVPGRVPGKTNATKDNLTLHKNVKDAIIVYAKNEVSYGFEPVIPVPTHPEETNLQYVVMPGHHATLPGNPFWRNSVNADFRVEESGRIVRWMLETFLKEHGTLLRDSPYRGKEKITKRMLLDFFEKIIKDEKIYQGFETNNNDLYTRKKYKRREAYYGPEAITMLGHWTSYLDVALASEYEKKERGYVNYLHEYLATKLPNVKDDDEVNLQDFILSTKRAEEAKNRAREAEISKEVDEFEKLDTSREHPYPDSTSVSPPAQYS